MPVVKVISSGRGSMLRCNGQLQMHMIKPICLPKWMYKQ